MNELRRLTDLGVPVNWKTVLAGWDGPSGNERQIDTAQVIEFASRELGESPKMSTGEVLALASLDTEELDEVDRLLRDLAHQDRSSGELEVRKWRLLMLYDLLDALPQDPLYAWLALAEFWHSFGNPNDAPAILDDFERQDPAKRYTVEVRKHLISAHQNWLEKEVARLSSRS